MSKSKIFLYFCLSFIGGIFLNSFLRLSDIHLFLFLLAGIFFISLFWTNKKSAVFGFCLLFIAAGIWRHQAAETKFLSSPLLPYNDLKQEITLAAVVVKEPEVRERSQKLTVRLKSRKEKILLTTNLYPEYRYDDELKITGFLKNPPILDGFNYRDYLKKDGVYSTMNFPGIELTASGSESALMKFPLYFKDKFRAAAEKFLSPPQSGILEALAFGDESELSADWKNKLNITGTRHIAAVSGMNVTIIGFLILSFFIGLGFWRQQAFFISIFMLALYILMVGAPSSALRAGIMAGILMTGQYFGRLSYATRAVVFAAAVMLIFNPFLLKLDIGFQLSFLAILGLIFFQPIFSAGLKKIPEPKILPLKTTFSATLSAQIFAAPVLLYNFGYISALSPLTNILIVPLLAPITILIFIFGISAMIFAPLGVIFYLPLWLSLSYIVGVVNLFSRLSFAALTLENLHWIWLLISYVFLAVIVWRLQERFTRPNFLR